MTMIIYFGVSAILSCSQVSSNSSRQIPSNSGHNCTAIFRLPVQYGYCKRTETDELIRCASRNRSPSSREFLRRIYE